MTKAVRLEPLILLGYDDVERLYVVEVFPVYPAPPLHPELVLSGLSQVRNDAPDWIFERCYMTDDFIFMDQPTSAELDSPIDTPAFPPIVIIEEE